MAFTSRLGTVTSQLGNLELGVSTSNVPAQYVQVVPSGKTPKYFTGQLGLVLSQPGNIVPGRPFMRLLKGIVFTANTTLLGNLLDIQNYTGAFRQSSILILRATARAFNFLTQPRNTAQ